MKDKTEDKKTKKGFFSRMIEKFDKKMEEKSKSKSCCCGDKNNPGNKSCCS